MNLYYDMRKNVTILGKMIYTLPKKKVCMEKSDHTPNKTMWKGKKW
jgi:hypothetical protein